MRIAVDLDGVCYNFTAALASYIEQVTGERFSTKPQCWEFYATDWGMPLAEYLYWFKEGVDAGWIFALGEPAPGCIEALTALRADGHTIHLCTERNIGRLAKVNTAKWLEAVGMPYDSLTFVTGDKSETLIADIAIDDRPKNVDQWIDAGVLAYCMGFDEREDMRAHPAYIPYDWDNFRCIVNEAETLMHNIEVQGDIAMDWTPMPGFDPQTHIGPSEWLAHAESEAIVRTFETGATRDTDNTKPDYEGYYTPRVIHCFGEYMTKNRHLKDGSLRDSDNWQKGMPREVYMKSLWRHFHATWWEHRRWLNGEPEYNRSALIEDLCGVIFNAQGMLDTVLKEIEQEARV